MDEAARHEIEGALARGEIARAAALAEGRLALGERAPLLLNLAAWTREEAGDYRGADALLCEALALTPGDPLILSARAGVARKQGDPQTALRHTGAILRDHPHCGSAWLERGYAQDAIGSIAAARDSFGRAAGLEPNNAPAWAGLAHAAGRLGDMAAARTAAGSALRLNPEEPLALLAMVRWHMDQQEFGTARQLLDRLLASTPSLNNRIMALALLGGVCHALARYDEAFDAYAQANAAFRALYGSGPPEPQTEFTRRIESSLRSSGLAGRPPLRLKPVPGEARRHVFLLGFPRSGTTLMENILASLPGAHALEERPTLRMADEAFLLPSEGMSDLAGIDEATAERFRAAYWDAVFAAGVARDAASFVDMDPLKSLRLPIIARLFPDAHVVQMRRDPRDVVWSCFRTAFAPSSAAFEFTSLERAAALYAATMRLIDTCRSVLPLKMKAVSYEALVSDFEGETRGLCDFLGVGWTQDLLRFDRTAQRRGVGTASVMQVRRGLYDGSGQWQPYRRYLEPVLPNLQPWIDN
jgi:tetratricopeptide (TPR) repeat protein